MPQWSPRLDWARLQNWLPGAVGVSRRICWWLLPPTPPRRPIQSWLRWRNPQRWRPKVKRALPQLLVSRLGLKHLLAQTRQLKHLYPRAPAAVATTGEAAKPPPMHDHAIVKAEAVTAPAQVKRNPGNDGQRTEKSHCRSPPYKPARRGCRRATGLQEMSGVSRLWSQAKLILGPSLAGIVGRKSGAEPNFNYSPAMKQAALTWDAAHARRLLDGSPEDRYRQPNAVSGSQDRSGPKRRDCVSGERSPRRPKPSRAGTFRPAAAPPIKPSNDPAYLTDAKYNLPHGDCGRKKNWAFLESAARSMGKANPVLTAAEGQVVQVTLINGEGTEHDIVFPDQDAKSPRVNGKGASTTIVFRATKSGEYLDLFLQCPRSPVGGYAGSVSGDTHACAAITGRAEHLLRTHRPSSADRQTGSKDRQARSVHR